MDKYNSSKYGGGSSNSKYAKSAIAEAEQKKQQGFWRPTPKTTAEFPTYRHETPVVYRTPRSRPNASKSTAEALTRPAPGGNDRVMNTVATHAFANAKRPPEDRRSMSPPEDLDHPFYMRPPHNYSPMHIPADQSQHVRLDREGRCYFPPGSAYRWCTEVREEHEPHIYRHLCQLRDEVHRQTAEIKRQRALEQSRKEKDHGYSSGM